jgi:hypothetical protein
MDELHEAEERGLGPCDGEVYGASGQDHGVVAGRHIARQPGTEGLARPRTLSWVLQQGTQRRRVSALGELRQGVRVVEEPGHAKAPVRIGIDARMGAGLFKRVFAAAPAPQRLDRTETDRRDRIACDAGDKVGGTRAVGRTQALRERDLITDETGPAREPTQEDAPREGVAVRHGAADLGPHRGIERAPELEVVGVAAYCLVEIWIADRLGWRHRPSKRGFAREPGHAR